MVVDYLIVGQGIGGSLLAYFLEKAGVSIAVVDDNHFGAASSVAAGIINPVTGRRFVKSWRIDQLLPFAEKTYLDIQEKAGQNFYNKRDILWALSDNQQQNDWYSRRYQPGYAKFIKDVPDVTGTEAILKASFCWVELTGAATVDLPGIIGYFRDLLLERKQLLSERFNPGNLDINHDHVVYNSVKAKKIIFCQGHQSRENPFFKDLPHQPAKGEALIVKIPGFDTDKLIKSGVFLVPVGDQLFWVGSTYVWKFQNDQPTPKGKSDLVLSLKELLRVPFEVVAHKAAIRPVFKDRRPVIGIHQNYPQIGIFNGLGTKGASMAPLWANHFARYLTGKVSDIDREVDICRFQK